MSANVRYKQDMSQTGEKKTEQILINLDLETFKLVNKIAASDDRPRGYVARELMIRGLNLYRQDGLLKDATANGERTANENSKQPYGRVKTIATDDLSAKKRRVDVPARKRK